MLFRSACSALVVLCVPAVAGAADFFQVRNDNQLARAVPLPVLAPDAPEPGQLDFGTRLDLSNEYANLQAGDEALLADGEVARLTLSASGRFTAATHWSVRLPVLHQGGGFLDGTISDWHDFFGLPNGGREFAVDDRYLFAYAENGETLLQVDDKGTRIGDLEVAWHWEPAERWLLGAHLQVPTGDGDKLAGGGAIGAAVWATRRFAAGPLDAFLSGGVAVSEPGDILPDRQRRTIPFGGAGIGLRLFDWMRAVTQVYAHRAPFSDTDINTLGRDSVQLSVGAVFRLPGKTRLHLLFQEDLGVYASPDFSLQAALYW